MTSLPMEVPVSYQEIAHCLEKSVAKIENAILSALEQTPAELYTDIVEKGIYLAGGGALLRGLDKRLTDKLISHSMWQKTHYTQSLEEQESH